MSRHRERSAADALLIARVAGLPAAAMAPLAGEGCAPVLEALAQAEAELAAARRELGEHLHRVIPATAPRERRFLLALKRDCHNGRSLLPYRSQPWWHEVSSRLGEWADRVPALEERVLSLQEELDRAHARELERESRHLLALAAEPGLRRGLALSSPSLVASLPRLAEGSIAGEGRRERRVRLSLLRYVSRAALKLSPLSTLTRFALARMGEPAVPVALLGRPAEWQELSLVRLRRYLVDQIAAALLRNPLLRASLPVGLNPSLREIAPGRYRLLQPVGCELPDDRPAARQLRGRPREVPVDRAVVDWLQGHLTGTVPWSRLLAGLAELVGGEERAGSLLGRLYDLGVLVLAPPWSGQDPRLEEMLLAWVGRFPQAPQLSAVARPLADLVELEKGFHQSREPTAAIAAIENRLEEAWRAAREAAGLATTVPLERRKDNELYEDVLLLGAPRAERLEVDRRYLKEILQDVEPWFRLVDLFAPRYELLASFAALARRRWPERSEIAALELFAEALPLWPEIRRLLAEPPPPSAESPAVFNPLDLPEVAELGHLRQAVWSELRALLGRERGESESRLTAGELCALVAGLPPHYAPRLGPCLFLQPADSAGRSWVLNRIFEGTGRFGSRVTPLLPEALRRDFVEHLVACSTRRGDEESDVLDLVSGRGDNLNVHAVQTHRVLTLPGEPSPVPAGRRVEPGELRVRWTGPLPELVDAAGRRLLPVHLGTAALAYTPPLIAFLALFGTGELRPLPPPQPRRRQGDVEVLGRVVLGRLVLARRRFSVPSAVLRELLTPPSSRAFPVLDRWRRAHGIPAAVFALERVRFGARTSIYKPQFLDFRSPSFCELLEVILRGNDERLVLEEMLPGPDAFPRDAAGQAWAVELQVDSFSILW